MFLKIRNPYKLDAIEPNASANGIFYNISYLIF